MPTTPSRRSTVAHQPDERSRRTVESMTGFGIPAEDIARVIGISRDTLDRKYRLELDTGTVKANTQVAQHLFKIATGTGPGATAAAIFWLKARAGWSEYAPAPVSRPHAEPPLGKKEQAQVASEEAGRGNEWGHLVH